MIALAFAPADIARLEGLAFYFGDDCSGLCPRRHISAREARLAFALADTARLDGLAFYFDDDYFDPRHRLFRTRLLKNLRPQPASNSGQVGLGDRAD